MASKAKIKKCLEELEVEFIPKDKTVNLAKLLVSEVKKIGHADGFSPELRKVLIDDYYFKILDKDGNELDENLEVKK